MEVTRHTIPRWLWPNALALVFSFVHYVQDWHIGLFGATSNDVSMAQAALVIVSALIYGCWAVSLVVAALGNKCGLLSVVIINIGWAFAGNGLVIAACPPPCQGAFPFQDIAHVGSLVFGIWGAYAAWR